MAPEGTTGTIGDNSRELPGGNTPPSDLEILAAKLAEDNADVVKRANDLLASVTRVPDVVSDEKTATDCATLLDMLRKCITAAETRHKPAKQPFLDGGNAVDGWLNSIKHPLLAGAQKVKGRLELYLQERDTKARKAALEEADRLRAEAATRTAAVQEQVTIADVVMVPVISSNLAAVGYDAKSLQLHIQFKSKPSRHVYHPVAAAVHASLMAAPSVGKFYIAEIRANKAYTSREVTVKGAAVVEQQQTEVAALQTQAAKEEARAEAKPSALTQVRGATGAVASLKRTVDYKVVDLTKLPAHFLMLNIDAVKAHIKTRKKDELPDTITGLEFVWKSSL